MTTMSTELIGKNTELIILVIKFISSELREKLRKEIDKMIKELEKSTTE